MKKKKLLLSQRLQRLPPYLFAQIERKKQKLRKRRVVLKDLSIGDPDILAPWGVINTLYRSAKQKDNQKYALDQGKENLRNSIKKWMKKRFGINLDKEREILPLIGSKEGLVHLPLAFVNPGEYVLVPSPGYPGYRGAVVLALGKIYEMPLREDNNFLPSLEKIPLGIRNKSKLMYLNYPNNPTTALAPREFLKEVVKFCSHYGIILAYDNAYSEIYFERKPLSIFQIKGAEEIAIEFHSFSKTFCMTGFRIGWASGNKGLIKCLLKIKTNIDSGIFGAIQDAGAYALDKEKGYVRNLRKIIRERRDFFVKGLNQKGFKKIYAYSTFYVWVKIPLSFKSSMDFSHYLLNKKIVATPGIGFGKYGEGFVRFALTVDITELKEAIRRI